MNKAVVMAGGEGTRLRPLTCGLPKPMARLCGRPVLEYILELLYKNGVESASLTLRYLPHLVTEHFEGGRFAGVSLDFVLEDTPLGTAGSVANAARDFSDDFLVISGDALCDFDLKAAMDYHKSNRATATLVVKKVPDPREYGLVRQKGGRVAGFVEKPGYSQAVSDLANTGVYLLNPSCLKWVPEGKPFDFSKDLFPLLLQKGEPVLAYEEQGYWCDIGDLDTYARCQRDMLAGRVKVNLNAENIGGVYCKGERPTGDWKAEAPCYLGEGVQIGEGAFIGAGTVLDDGCRVEAGASVRESVLLQNALAGKDARIIGAVVCENAAVERGASLYEKSAVGADTVIGAFAEVHPGIKIWPEKTVGARAVITEHIKTGGMPVRLFDEEGLSGELGVDITPELCAKIGQAAGSLKGVTRAGIAASGGKGASALKAAAAAGLMACGVQVWDFGAQGRAALAYCLDHCSLDLGLLVDDTGETAAVRLVAPGGLPLNRAQEREMESRLSRSEFIRKSPEEYGDYTEASAVAKLYGGFLASLAKGIANVAVNVSESGEAGKFLKAALEEAGVPEGSDLSIVLSHGGSRAEMKEKSGKTYSFEQLLCLYADEVMARGENIAVPYDAPGILNRLAAKRGKKVLRYFYCPADTSDKAARELAKTQPFVRDGLQLSIGILRMISEKGTTLSRLVSGLPAFSRSEAVLTIRENPGKILKAFAQDASEEDKTIPEGVSVSRENGTVLIKPLKNGSGIRVLAEAENAEFADELCAFYKNSINKMNLTQE